MCLLLALGSTNIYANDWEHLFQRAKYQDVKISPDGQYLAIIVDSHGQRALAFLSRETMETIGTTKLPDINEVGNFHWVNNERVVLKIIQRKPWQEEPLYYGELFAVNVDGSQTELIYGYRNGGNGKRSRLKKKKKTNGWAELVNRLDDDEENILIMSTLWDEKGSRLPSLYKLNVYTGKLKKQLISSPVPYADFITDSSGNVKVVTGINENNEREVHIRKNRKWHQLPPHNYGQDFQALTIDETGKNLFVIDNFGQDKSGLFKLNLNTGKLKKIITDKKVDISQVKYTSDGNNIYALGVDDGFPSYYVLNKALKEAQVFKVLISAFPGQSVDITSKTDDGNVYIVKVSSDIEAGKFYLYDQQENKLRGLFKYYPDINSNELAYTDPIEFTSSDGLRISGYFTEAKHQKENAIAPLVVLVHGGPHSRDYWKYSSEVQFLALNGYSVLQVNFRGSDGFGYNFEAAGYKNWGSLIQRDIFEAFQWAVQSGLADKDKACIMGASFGGYSAIQSAIKYPDTYQCAIAYAGVYDLDLMYEKGNIQNLGFGKAYINQTLGTDAAVRKKMSPVHNVEPINIPLLLAHGEEDEQVPFEHAVRLKSSLDAAKKPYEWHTFGKESHGFFDPDNQKKYMKHVLAFLSKHTS
ncbi:alpha/beta hydrolase family protein [Thalassotalea atypica]|uniref:alpha/beta hydrolase family protein n=1 Tax=Thalassotalea atypica TaxID=2054316 RepID=UPI0025722666|nr:alpha/beta fold hydrolase [Thalassotalea atypica]